jgi:hypothetical protein
MSLQLPFLRLVRRVSEDCRNRMIQAIDPSRCHAKDGRNVMLDDGL